MVDVVSMEKEFDFDCWVFLHWLLVYKASLFLG